MMHRLRERWIYSIKKFAILLLFFQIGSTIIGFYFGSKLNIDTNLYHLLPEETVSLQDFQSLKALSTVTGHIVLLIESDHRNPTLLLQAVHEIENIVFKNPFLKNTTTRFIYSAPTDFLMRFGLYYADLTDLIRIRNRLDETIKKKKKAENPYYFDLESDSTHRFFIGDIISKYQQKYNDSNIFFDKDKKNIAILITPKNTPDDTDLTRTYVNILTEQISTILQPKGLRAKFSGSFMHALEKKERVSDDIRKSSLLTIFILIISLVIFFRSIRSILVIGLPLLSAMSYTYLFAYLVTNQISIISSFLASILLGLGVDYGIHLYARYKAERVKGAGMSLSLDITLKNLFRGLSFGMITTAAVFAAISFSDFKAFAEFGRIAFVGVAFFFLSYLLYFPMIIFISERYSFTITETSRMLEKTHKVRGWKIVLLTVIMTFGFKILLNPPFELDFLRLDAPPTLNKDTNQILEILSSRENPIIYEVDNLLELAQLKEQLKKISLPKSVEQHSLLDLIPDRIGEKKEIIAQIRLLLRQAEIYSIANFDSENLRKIQLGLTMTEEVTFSIGQIPEEFREHLMSVQKPYKYFYYVFTQNDRLQKSVLQIASQLKNICIVYATNYQCTKSLSGISELYVMQDILRMVLKDLTLTISILIGVIAVIILSLTRQLPGFFLIAFPLAGGIFGLFALVGAINYFFPETILKFNYISLLSIPIIMGIGIDNGIYLYTHTRELGLYQVHNVLNNTGGSIFISNFTTAMGFLSLAISTNTGLVSFGVITFLGMACIFYSYRVLFPVLGRVFDKAGVQI